MTDKERRQHLARLARSVPENVLAQMLQVAEPCPAPSTVSDLEEAARLFEPLLLGRATEALAALALNNRHAVISCEILAEGTDTHCIVCPRQILRWALLQGRSGAKSLIIAHNHPSGSTTPSAQDDDVTQRLAIASNSIGIRLLDHLILADGTAPFSYARESCVRLSDGRRYS